MGKKRKKLQTVEAFEKALGEEISISAEFDLPLTVLAAGVEGGWEEGTLRRALDTLRVVDLVTRPGPSELLIVLPNTKPLDARGVEERFREVVPEAILGIAAYNRGDAAGDLLKRARGALRAAENPEAPS